MIFSIRKRIRGKGEDVDLMINITPIEIEYLTEVPSGDISAYKISQQILKTLQKNLKENG